LDRTVADSRSRGATAPSGPTRGSGMPELIRATGGSVQARLRHDRFHSQFRLPFRVTAAAGALALLPTTADAAGWSWLIDSPYLPAFLRLEQHEIAALTLILGVVIFAVLTSILLVRSRARAAADGAAAREKIAALKSDVDQLTGLLLSEPHILVSWAAASD